MSTSLQFEIKPHATSTSNLRELTVPRFLIVSNMIGPDKLWELLSVVNFCKCIIGLKVLIQYFSVMLGSCVKPVLSSG